jgi:two-component system, sensor histidine kinase and response regulator
LLAANPFSRISGVLTSVIENPDHARAEAIFHGSAVGSLLLDPSARVLCANQAFARLLEVPMEALPGRALDALISSDQAVLLRDHLHALNCGTVDSARLELCFEDELFSEVWADVALAAQRGPKGELISIVVSAMDSSERRRRDQYTAQRFGLTLQSAELGQWEWLVASDALDVDAYWAMTLGYADGRLKPRMEALMELVHPDDRKSAQDDVDACLEGQAAEFSCELRMRHADGRWIWVVHQGMVVEREPAGACKRVIGTTKDVTRRKTAELALRRSQQHQLLAMNSASLGQWEWNTKDDSISFDARCAELFGRSPINGTIERTAWLRFVDSEDVSAVEAHLAACMRSEAGGISLEHRAVHPERGRIWLRNCGQMVERDELGRPLHIVGLYEDITDRKLAEEELRAAKEKAEAASRAKSAFLANMSHEIRTPMNAMIGLTRLVLDADLKPRERDFLQKVHASSLSLLAILNDILDLSKIEAGRMVAEQTPFSLTSVLGSVMQLFEQQAKNKGLILRRQFDAFPRSVAGDPARLTQVLSNLVGNAIKFTASGEVRVQAELQPAGDDAVELRCTVHDTGVGLTAEQVARLFQPFSQADESVTRRYGGTGLGLAISRQLVALMGGKIGVSSVPGEGCSFSFTVPLGLGPSAIATPAPAPTLLYNRVAPSTQGRRFDGARILLVDDIALNREVAVEILRGLGAHVVEASDGEQALAELAHRQWDLVLMDLHMPVLDGLSAMHRLAALPPERRPPVVALTASVMDEDRARCHEAGMVDFIAKPVDAENILRVLARWVSRPTDFSRVATNGEQPGRSGSPTTTAGDTALLHRMAPTCVALRPYLKAQELVPDELIDQIRQAAAVEHGSAQWQRLLDLIFDFDHAGALLALETVSTE